MDLLLIVPGLEECLMEADQDEIMRISEHVLFLSSLLLWFTLANLLSLTVTKRR